MDESDVVSDSSEYDEESMEESPHKGKQSGTSRVTRVIDESEEQTSSTEISRAPSAAEYVDDSMEESPNYDERSGRSKAARVIDESEEQTSSTEISRAPSAASSILDSNEDGRLTPFIKGAIRRSIHQFRKSSSEEEESADEEEDENPAIDIRDSSEESETEAIANHTRRVRNAILDESSDEESFRSSIQETISPKKQPSAESETTSNNRHRNRVVSDEESTEDEGASSRESSPMTRSFVGKSVSPEKPEIRKRPRDRDYNPDVSYDDSDSDDDGSSVSIDESSPEVKNHREAKVSALNNSASSVEFVKVPKKTPHVIDLDSSEDENKENDPGNTSQNDVAISLAKQETLNTTFDPVMAQEKALLVYKQQSLQSQLAKSKMLYNSGNMDLLPDRGERLRESITMSQKELEKVTRELREIQLKQSMVEPNLKPKLEKPAPLFKQDSLEVDPTYLQPTTSGIDRELGKKAQATLQREQDLTVERLKDLHGSLVARPQEDERAEDPRGLKVPLMPHQQHALAWLLWREQQKPPGGVLADDMGLGKTLTMIALIMASIARSSAGDGSDDEDEWRSSARPQKYLGGTLVVAPASLLAQWEAEVNNRCRRGLLSVELYHGQHREKVPKRLAKTNMVVTTYNILAREFKEHGVLYKICWRRVILDEAHVIRNHKSQTCEAVCGLHARKRWALSGTPVQNKEMDLYSILKFLECSPFDDLRVWKRWVDNKNAAGLERLATVMKSLMLRRTKAELQAKGALDTMPDKSVEVILVELDPEERLVYDKVMVYSRTLFAQFLAQRAEKNHMFELGAGKYDKPSWTTNVKETQFTKAQKKLLSLHADVKSHEILVLLLRLRQVCCHPSLIHAMLDQEDIETAAIEDGGTDIDLLAKMSKMKIKTDSTDVGGDNDDDEDYGVDERVAEHLLTSDNPVFDTKRQSSKMRAVLAKVQEILEKGDKMIIVSQWVGVLNVVADELDNVPGASWRMFTGQVAVKDRQGIMDEFNSRNPKPNVLLLSLTAGGVGLNLVGANHLFLIDIHWNPQLESQAQDRIYRFGQKKNVYIYKYICSDTIEERIKALQEAKLELADAVLSGGGKVVSSKLSLDDIKSLFSL